MPAAFSGQARLVTLTPLNVSPLSALPTFARLYGCSEADFAQTAEQMTTAWILQSGQETLGALGLRPSPAHGAEVVGGALVGPFQTEAAVALLTAARKAQPTLYAYGEAHLLPAEALEASGLRVVGAYTRMAGPPPTQLPDAPGGFLIVSLSEVDSLPDRLLAQQSYSDLIGHTHVTAESVQPGAGGSDDRLSRLAYDAAGVPAGICRVRLEGDLANIGSPGVRPDLRTTRLRRALLLSASQAARSAGATRIQLDAWGETQRDRAEDQELGLEIEESTPIYSS